MKKQNTVQVGAASELSACSWLLRLGYEVFRNVAVNGPIDIVAMKGGVIMLVDVKTAALARDKYGTPTALARPVRHRSQSGIDIVLLHVTKCGKCFFDPEQAFIYLKDQEPSK